MKKLIAIVLTIMMCAALAACGGKRTDPPAEEPQTKATEEAAQSETTPEETTPEETTPEQTTPEETTPEQTTPEETTPEETTPEQQAAEDFEIVFKSDDTHFVMEQDIYLYVFEHDGKNITRYYGIADLDDEETAKGAVEAMNAEELPESVESIFNVGQYFIVLYKDSEMADYTIDQIEAVYGDKKVE